MCNSPCSGRRCVSPSSAGAVDSPVQSSPVRLPARAGWTLVPWSADTRGKHGPPDGNDRPVHSRQPTRAPRRPRRANNRCNCQRHRRNDSDSSLATATLSAPVSARYRRDSVATTVTQGPRRRVSVVRRVSATRWPSEWAAADVDGSSSVLSSLRRPCCATFDAAAKTRMNTRRRHYAPSPPSPPVLGPRAEYRARF